MLCTIASIPSFGNYKSIKTVKGGSANVSLLIEITLLCVINTVKTATMPLRLLTPRQASNLLGVSESTVRRWCDAGQLAVSKTSGGHRRIELNHLLQFARELELTVVSMGAADTAGQGGRVPAGSELALRFYQQLSARGAQHNPCEFAQDLVRQLGEVETLCDQVVSPALHRIGEEWSAGTLRIHQEHVATQECLQALLASHAQFPAQADQHVAVCAGLSNDPYLVAPTMCSLAVRSAGFRSVLLGPNAPAEEILLSAIEQKAVLIAVSVSALVDSVAELAALCEKAETLGIRVALGGRGLDVELRKQLKPDFFGDSMTHLVAYAKRLQKALHDEPKAHAGLA
jgi:excisionase family DNA binding protein